MEATAEEAECAAQTRTDGSDRDIHLRRDDARGQAVEVAQNDGSPPRFVERINSLDNGTMSLEPLGLQFGSGCAAFALADTDPLAHRLPSEIHSDGLEPGRESAARRFLERGEPGFLGYVVGEMGVVYQVQCESADPVRVRQKSV